MGSPPPSSASAAPTARYHSAFDWLTHANSVPSGATKRMLEYSGAARVTKMRSARCSLAATTRAPVEPSAPPSSPGWGRVGGVARLGGGALCHCITCSCRSARGMHDAWTNAAVAAVSSPRPSALVAGGRCSASVAATSAACSCGGGGAATDGDGSSRAPLPSPVLTAPPTVSPTDRDLARPLPVVLAAAPAATDDDEGCRSRLRTAATMASPSSSCSGHASASSATWWRTRASVTSACSSSGGGGGGGGWAALPPRPSPPRRARPSMRRRTHGAGWKTSAARASYRCSVTACDSCSARWTRGGAPPGGAAASAARPPPPPATLGAAATSSRASAPASGSSSALSRRAYASMAGGSGRTRQSAVCSRLSTCTPSRVRASDPRAAPGSPSSRAATAVSNTGAVSDTPKPACSHRTSLAAACTSSSFPPRRLHARANSGPRPARTAGSKQSTTKSAPGTDSCTVHTTPWKDAPRECSTSIATTGASCSARASSASAGSSSTSVKEAAPAPSSQAAGSAHSAAASAALSPRYTAPSASPSVAWWCSRGGGGGTRSRRCRARRCASSAHAAAAPHAKPAAAARSIVA